MGFVDITGLEKINLFSRQDRIYPRAEKVKDIPGSLVILAHGDEHDVKDDTLGRDNRVIMDADGLARLIKSSGKWNPGMNITLYSCYTGKGDAPIAAELSKNLGVSVTAPKGYAIYLPNGFVDTGYFPFLPIGGGFKEFNP